MNSTNKISKTVQVGPSRDLKTPGDAKAIAEDGDIIEIDAGTYEGDYVIWTQNNLTLKGVGGKAHIKMGPSAIPNQKALWVIQGDNTTVENIEFSDATVPDKNGAGIRQEGTNLIVKNCYFHDNEDGILTSANSESEILIEYSEFANNGYGDGYSHNMYIGNIKKFTIQYSYTHHAKVGQNIKTRAEENYILYNRIMDSTDGTASRSIDVPDGGLTYIIGNVIQQGPKTQNSNMVGYASESAKNDIQEIYGVNNTLVSDRITGTYFNISNSPAVAKLINNLLIGENMAIVGATEETNNLEVEGSTLIDRENYDYHLKDGANAIDAGVTPGEVHGVSLTPVYQYNHPMDKSNREIIIVIDVGAFEYQSGTDIRRNKDCRLEIMPNPVSNILTIHIINPPNSVIGISLIDMQGSIAYYKGIENGSDHIIKIDCSTLQKGVYICKINATDKIFKKKIVVY